MISKRTPGWLPMDGVSWLSGSVKPITESGWPASSNNFSMAELAHSDTPVFVVFGSRRSNLATFSIVGPNVKKGSSR